MALSGYLRTVRQLAPGSKWKHSHVVEVVEAIDALNVVGGDNVVVTETAGGRVISVIIPPGNSSGTSNHLPFAVSVEEENGVYYAVMERNGGTVRDVRGHKVELIGFYDDVFEARIPGDCYVCMEYGWSMQTGVYSADIKITTDPQEIIVANNSLPYPGTGTGRSRTHFAKIEMIDDEPHVIQSVFTHLRLVWVATIPTGSNYYTSETVGQRAIPDVAIFHEG